MFGELCKDNHYGFWKIPFDFLHHAQPVLLSHQNVLNQHIGSQCIYPIERRLNRPGLADHIQPGVFRQRGAQPLSQHSAVIGDEGVYRARQNKGRPASRLVSKCSKMMSELRRHACHDFYDKEHDTPPYPGPALHRMEEGWGLDILGRLALSNWPCAACPKGASMIKPRPTAWE